MGVETFRNDGSVGEKYMYEKTDKTIDDYPQRELILADIIRLTDKKTHLYIIDRDTEEVLYNDRMEYLKWTSEGCASSLCGKKIKYIDSISDGRFQCIEVHLDMKDDDQTDDKSKPAEEIMAKFVNNHSDLYVSTFLEKITLLENINFRIQILGFTHTTDFEVLCDIFYDYFDYRSRRPWLSTNPEHQKIKEFYDRKIADIRGRTYNEEITRGDYHEYEQVVEISILVHDKD